MTVAPAELAEACFPAASRYQVDDSRSSPCELCGALVAVRSEVSGGWLLVDGLDAGRSLHVAWHHLHTHPHP